MVLLTASIVKLSVSGTISTMHQAHEFLEVVTVTFYRVATYATTHLIDDAAILALIFC
jgi:hypothetical protein